MTAADVAGRIEPFVMILRAGHPRTPIVLVEDRPTRTPSSSGASASATTRAARRSGPPASGSFRPA